MRLKYLDFFQVLLDGKKATFNKPIRGIVLSRDMRECAFLAVAIAETNTEMLFLRLALDCQVRQIR
jgi:hypothetical protein